MDTFLGLDFGGTKLLIGEVDSAGNVLRSKRYRTGMTEEEEAVDCIMKSLDDYISTVGYEGELKAAGIGIVGLSDCDKGLWISMYYSRKEPPIPLADMLSEKLGVPCGIDNDVRSATTAELILGKGKQSDNYIYINVGTGLAAGFVTGGHIIRGANYNSGEVGHMSSDMTNNLPCDCGRTGCSENAVSGIGFTRQIKERGRRELLDEYERADVPGIFRLAEAGDLDCIEIVEYASATLASLIMNLVRVTDPDTVILGGGVVSSEWFLAKVKNKLEPNTMRGVTEGVILSSFPIQYAGVIGAASLGMRLV